MAGVAAGISLEVVLMLGFGLPEVACWNDFSNTGTSVGLPLSLIKMTKNFAGLVLLAFRPTT